MTGFVEAARREKLKELLERGVAPYAYRFERTATAQQALAAYKRDDDPAQYALAGRLVALRPHGKTTFAHLEDPSGKIQLYFKGDELGTATYALLELLDLGDHLGVEGRLMKTRTGEITLRVARFTLLSKALRPLPLGKEDASGVKHGELSDPEVRSRQPDSARNTGLPRWPGVSGSGDAGAAAAVRRRRGGTVRDALRGAGHDVLSPHRRRAVPQALSRRRARAGVRDRSRFSQRGAVAVSQSGIHDGGVVSGVRGLQRHGRAHRGDAGRARGAAVRHHHARASRRHAVVRAPVRAHRLLWARARACRDRKST